MVPTKLYIIFDTSKEIDLREISRDMPKVPPVTIEILTDRGEDDLVEVQETEAVL